MAPAWVEIDADALVHNARVLRRATPPEARLGLMVKADGYGHGLVPAARAAVEGGADLLMVATLDEGLRLRAAGIDAPALVVYPVPPDGVGDALDANLQLSVAGLDSTRRLLEALRVRQPLAPRAVLELHVEVDTGMGRGGVAPADLATVLELIDAAPATRLVGVWSHLADGQNAAVTTPQVERYEAALASMAAAGRPTPLRHLIATEPLFAETAPAYDMVRIGIGYYGELGLGYEPTPRMAPLAAELRPAMAIHARPVRLERVEVGTPVGYGQEWRAERPSLIATLPIGYADGWSRRSWPGAEALVRGRRVPLVGRVSMDSICVDVTDVDGVSVTDTFTLLGADGDERIRASDLARLLGTIPNEVYCSFVGPRLGRVVRGAAEASGGVAIPAKAG